MTGTPVAGIRGELRDDVRELPEQRIAWTTTWRMCWDAVPGARSYQLRPLTGEGAATSLRVVQDTCHELQSAAGENPRAEGLRDRDLQLALQKGQLAYAVRAVRQDGSVTPWSAAIAVGEEEPVARAASGSPSR